MKTTIIAWVAILALWGVIAQQVLIAVQQAWS